MRVALIATGEQGAAPVLHVAGRSLVLRQFDFARIWGAERIIAFGSNVPGDGDALRQEAERAGLAYSAIASAHALIPLVDWRDELLVLQPGLLPEAPLAIAALRSGHKVLAFTADEARNAVWERIDARSHWAGALTLPGALADRLEELGEDADPHAALLRIALQAGLPIETLDPDVQVNGAWMRLRGDERGAALCALRLGRHRPASPREEPTRGLAGTILNRFAGPLCEQKEALGACVALALLLPCAALFAAWSGLAALAFAVIALGVLALEMALGLDRIGRAAFQSRRLSRWLDHVPDGALLLVGMLAIGGPWFRQIFPPIVLLVAVRAVPWRADWRDAVHDRGLGALLVAIAALGGSQEPALMGWALLALAAGWARVSRTAVSPADGIDGRAEQIPSARTSASAVDQRSETGT